MKRIIICLTMVLLLSISVVLAQEKRWISSGRAKLKADKSASSETITTLSIGTEVTVIAQEGRWYRILTPSGEEGWIYRGRLSDSPPAEEIKEESDNLFAFMPGSSIEADEADTARSIRGLSRETEQYAQSRGTPTEYKRALDRVLAMGVSEQALEEFLRNGKIGEYAE